MVSQMLNYQGPSFRYIMYMFIYVICYVSMMKHHCPLLLNSGLLLVSCLAQM